jgi:hypothetical protein
MVVEFSHIFGMFCGCELRTSGVFDVASGFSNLEMRPQDHSATKLQFSQNRYSQ